MEPSNTGGGDAAAKSVLESNVVRYNAKLGILFFLAYLVIYATFVFLCTFNLDFMSQPWIGGVNVAIWYGFGLIGAAFVMAAAYLMLCRH